MMSNQLPGSKRKETLREYDHECEFCGANGGLEVHHIDGNASNHDSDNLIAVCHECHMNIHYPERDDCDNPERFREWNDKILPRDERKTGDELSSTSGSVYEKTGSFRCSDCGFSMPAFSEPKYCPQCETDGSMNETTEGVIVDLDKRSGREVLGETDEYTERMQEERENTRD